MEPSSSREEINRRRRTEEIYCLHSPCCYLCNKLVQAIMQCLGVEIHEQPASSSPSYNQEESHGKTNEEREVTGASKRSIAAVGRRPTRPPVSSGSGGQIN